MRVDGSILVRSKAMLYVAIAAAICSFGGPLLFREGGPFLPIAILALVYWARFGRATAMEAKLRADHDGLWVNDVLVLATSSIKRGRVIVRTNRPPFVDLRARGLRLGVRVLVPDAKRAQKLLEALGIDRREGTRRFTLPGWRLTSALAMFGLYVSSMLVISIPCAFIRPREPFMMFPLVGAGLVVMLAKLATRVTLTIARDGLLLESFRRSTFIRFKEIASLERMPGRGRAAVSPGFFVNLVTGRSIPLHTLDERLRGEGMYVGDHVMDALDKAMRRVRRKTTIRMLERGERETRAWLAALRTAAEARSYRDAPISSKDLLDVVGDASASDEMRSAAAAALACLDEPKLRKQLQRLTKDIAAPTVRAALDAALRDDDAALVAALDLTRNSDRAYVSRPR